MKLLAGDLRAAQFWVGLGCSRVDVDLVRGFRIGLGGGLDPAVHSPNSSIDSLRMGSRDSETPSNKLIHFLCPFGSL